MQFVFHPTTILLNKQYSQLSSWFISFPPCNRKKSPIAMDTVPLETLDHIKSKKVQLLHITQL
jgi:hypothetical protein